MGNLASCYKAPSTRDEEVLAHHPTGTLPSHGEFPLPDTEQQEHKASNGVLKTTSSQTDKPSSNRDPVSTLELPYDVLQLVLSKVNQPAGITRRVCKDWREAADSLVTSVQPCTPHALQRLPQLCPNVTALDLSAFCTPPDTLQQLSSLQNLHQLSVRCWPSETAACLHYLQTITALSSLSLSSPCQAAECQLGFHDPADHISPGRLKADALLSRQDNFGSTSNAQLAHQNSICSIDLQVLSPVQVFRRMPALRKLQIDKHTASLLLPRHIPAWLNEGLEGCSSITLDVSGIHKLAESLAADASSDQLSEQCPDTFAKALLQPERLSALSCSAIQELQPEAGEPFASRLQQVLVSSEDHYDLASAQPRARNLTQLQLLGHSLSSSALVMASKMPLLQVVSLSVICSDLTDFTVLQQLKQLSNLCLEITPAPVGGQLLYENLSELLQGCHRLNRLGIIMAIIPRDFAIQATATAEEVFLSTDSHSWDSLSGSWKLKPWQGPVLPGPKCTCLDLPWPPNPHEILGDSSLADTMQLRHLAFPLIPTSTLNRRRRLVDWGAPCMSTLVSLRLDVRPVDGLQDCWEQGVANLTALTSLSIIGGKPIEMYGRFHMKAMAHGTLKPISQLTRLRQLTIDIIQPLAEREIDALHSLSALDSLFLGDIVQISDLALALLMPLRNLSSVHLRHMNPLPHTERPVVSVEALARFAAGHAMACKLCLGEVASCHWHQTPLSRRFEPDVGLLLDFQGISALAALCPHEILAGMDGLTSAAAVLRSVGSPLCRPIRIKEVCTGSRALAAFQLPSSKRFLKEPP
ncbi:hypothetical protein WJX74_009656 [Apatococcus lobatus]|uniref:F-box domain-containing protein n=1 Tax=Apatococcus lobatus TaxID=904363 RepID=A0AAW1QDB5_9CHLO